MLLHRMHRHRGLDRHRFGRRILHHQGQHDGEGELRRQRRVGEQTLPGRSRKCGHGNADAGRFKWEVYFESVYCRFFDIVLYSGTSLSAMTKILRSIWRRWGCPSSWFLWSWAWGKSWPSRLQMIRKAPGLLAEKMVIMTLKKFNMLWNETSFRFPGRNDQVQIGGGVHVRVRPKRRLHVLRLLPPRAQPLAMHFRGEGQGLELWVGSLLLTLGHHQHEELCHQRNHYQEVLREVDRWRARKEGVRLIYFYSNLL